MNNSNLLKLALHGLELKAHEAHLAGDGARAHHLAMTAINYLDKKCDDDLPDYHEVRWVFTIACLWAPSHTSLCWLDRLLEKYEKAHDTPFNWHFQTVKAVYAFLDNGFGTIDECSPWIRELPWPKIEIEDLCLLDDALVTLVIELIWIRHKTEADWVDLVSSWRQQIVTTGVNQRLSNTMLNCVNRLKTQSDMLYGGTTKEGTSYDMAKLFALYLNCEHDRLQEELVEHCPNDISNNQYIPYYNLVHRSRFHLAAADDQMLSRSRMSLVQDSRPLQRHLQVLRDSFLSAYYRHIRKLHSGANSQSELKSMVMAAQLSELHSLRIWDFVQALFAIRDQANAFLELSRLFDKHDEDFLFCAIHAIRFFVTSESVPEKDKQLALLLLALDRLELDDKERLIDWLLNSPRVRWPYVAVILLMLEDGVPESKIPQVIDWFLNLEGNRLRFKSTYLDELTVFIEHSDDFNARFDQIKPTLLSHLSQKQPISEFWSNITKLAYKRACDSTVIEIVDAILGNAQASISSKWHSIFDACHLRPELAFEWKKWLIENKPEGPEYSTYACYVDCGFSNTTVNDPNLRQFIIETLEGYVERITNGPNHPFREMTITDFSHICRLTTWPARDANRYIAIAVQFINSGMADPGECLDLFQSLASIAQKATAKSVIAILAKHVNEWLTSEIKYYDIQAASNHPLSNFRMHGRNPGYVIRGLFWLAYNLMETRFIEVYPSVSRAIILKANQFDEQAQNVVFAAMTRIVFHGNPVEESVALAMTALANGIASNASDEIMPVIIKEFAAFLEPGDVRYQSLIQGNNSKAISIYFDFWRDHLLCNATSMVPNIRTAVARALLRWQKAANGCEWLIFDEEMDSALKQLAKDLRVRVRNASR